MSGPAAPGTLSAMDPSIVPASIGAPAEPRPPAPPPGGHPQPRHRPTTLATRRVLVATDCGPASLAAERAGLELARRSGASLVVVSVIDVSGLRMPGGIFHTRVDQVRARRESELGRILADARRAGIAAQYLIWEGEPGPSVLDAAEAEDADVIVLGCHARGALGRRFLGSVSAYVVDHSERPVVVIRPGQELDDVWPSGAAEPV